MDSDPFLKRLIAARWAAWCVLLVGVGLQLSAYGGYLALGEGGFSKLAESGLYGELAGSELSKLTLVYVALLKLMNSAIFLGALFLTLWVRGLRRAEEGSA